MTNYYYITFGTDVWFPGLYLDVVVVACIFGYCYYMKSRRLPPGGGDGDGVAVAVATAASTGEGGDGDLGQRMERLRMKLRYGVVRWITRDLTPFLVARLARCYAVLIDGPVRVIREARRGGDEEQRTSRRRPRRIDKGMERGFRRAVEVASWIVRARDENGCTANPTAESDAADVGEAPSTTTTTTTTKTSTAVRDATYYMETGRQRVSESKEETGATEATSTETVVASILSLRYELDLKMHGWTVRGTRTQLSTPSSSSWSSSAAVADVEQRANSAAAGDDDDDVDEAVHNAAFVVADSSVRTSIPIDGFMNMMGDIYWVEEDNNDDDDDRNNSREDGAGLAVPPVSSSRESKRQRRRRQVIFLGTMLGEDDEMKKDGSEWMDNDGNRGYVSEFRRIRQLCHGRQHQQQQLREQH